MAITLTSSAFQEGAAIPARYTCEGADISPPLAWSGAPSGTKAFALINDDPDAPAGTWVHWVLFNVPGGVTHLPEGAELSGALQGRNDSRKNGYSGPCPPPGKPHRYFFKLYALDAPLPLKPGATKADVEKAMQGHVLAETQLMGTFARKR